MARLWKLSDCEALELMERERQRRLNMEIEFITKMERAGVAERFVEGCDLQVDRISPEIHICRTEQDHNVFRYCCYLQPVPTGKLIGRQIRLIVLDGGQTEHPIMGVIGLSSSIYSMACRDDYLQWSTVPKSVKEQGLKCIMAMAICIAVPPYSMLLGGKLVAMLALTDVVREEFSRKYRANLPSGGGLLGMVTTCVSGKHCPIFHRIMIRRGGLYRRIGETSGYSTLLFSQETVRAARSLVQSVDGSTQYKFFLKSLRALKRALSMCGLPSDPILRFSNAKGVYFGTLCDEAIECLRKGNYEGTLRGLSVAEAFEYWRTNLLPKRTGRKATMEELRNFRKDRLCLSEQLDRV